MLEPECPSSRTPRSEPPLTAAGEGRRGTWQVRGKPASVRGKTRTATDRDSRAPVAGGPVLSVGRPTRTVPPHIRRALEERDRGCRFPGCASRFTEAHHVRHWADGGETSLSNLLLLCRRHHRAVHEGRVRVCTDRAGLALFFTRKGRELGDVPEASRVTPSGTRTTRLAGQVTRSGTQATLPAVASSLSSNGAAQYRDSDVPWAIEAAAREAVEETL